MTLFDSSSRYKFPRDKPGIVTFDPPDSKKRFLNHQNPLNVMRNQIDSKLLELLPLADVNDIIAVMEKGIEIESIEFEATKSFDSLSRIKSAQILLAFLYVNRGS